MDGLTRLCRVHRSLEPAFAGGRHAPAPLGPGARLPTLSLLAQDSEGNTNTAGSASARVSPRRRGQPTVYVHGSRAHADQTFRARARALWRGGVKHVVTMARWQEASEDVHGRLPSKEPSATNRRHRHRAWSRRSGTMRCSSWRALVARDVRGRTDHPLRSDRVSRRRSRPRSRISIRSSRWAQGRAANRSLHAFCGRGGAGGARAGQDFTIDDGNAERVGVLMGSGMGGAETLDAGMETVLTEGPGRLESVLHADVSRQHGVGNGGDRHRGARGRTSRRSRPAPARRTPSARRRRSSGAARPT